MSRWTRITPFAKQCFVTSSVTLNMFTHGFVYGFNTGLFAQLRLTKEIPMDLDSESWFASSVGLAFIFGSIFTSMTMDRHGRRPVFIVASTTMVVSWLIISAATSFTALLAAKILQGLSIGIGSNVGYVLIGEYTSPGNRAAFTATVPSILIFGDFLTHSISSVYNWHSVALALAFLSLPSLIFLVLSPESPSFLAKVGRHDQCRRVFLWLRGPDETNELEILIKTSVLMEEDTVRDENKSFRETASSKFSYLFILLKKKEVRLSLFIMLHLQIINQFSGALLYDNYTVDMHGAIYGTDTYVYMYRIVAFLDILRVTGSLLTIYLTRKLKRRLMLAVLVSLNIIAYLLLAVYILIKKYKILPFDHLSIGMVLHGLKYLAIATGSVPLPNIVAGEIFPLADRAVCGMIDNIVFSIYMFINIKSVPYIFSNIGVSGEFFINAGLLIYALCVVMNTLPETKDKTLLEIENELRGYSVCDDIEILRNK